MPDPENIVLQLADQQGASGVTLVFNTYDNTSTIKTLWVNKNHINFTLTGTNVDVMIPFLGCLGYTATSRR